ncbi:uncharacterized protein LOC105393818 [Plutella xylostella]|uniref:uncharacterized protein LOC105393818 n=1 Tax=Plutella xylostella TaxID=51655 RepID=UPI002032987C|nr:uncharacterized protein LOC105393818 [Plutella xylostella]
MVNTRSASKSALVAGATDSTGTEATATTATTSSGDTYTSTGASTDTSNEASSTAAASEVTAPASATARVPAPAPPAPTPATPKPVKLHTPRRACSNASSKGRRRELLKAKEELLKKQMELAAVRVAMLEEETDDEEEEDDTSTIRGVRMSEWVQQSTLALTMQPHHAVPREDAGATAGLPRRTSMPEPRIEASPPGAALENAAPPSARREPCPMGADEPRVQLPPNPYTSEPHVYEPPRPVQHRYDPRPSAFDYKELAEAIALAARALPSPPQHVAAPRHVNELPTFSGASSDWLPFKAAYEESAQSLTEQENLSRLRRAIKGAAKEAVHCLFIGTPSTREVMELLSAQFGRPDALIIHEMEKLRRLPKIVDTPKAICDFAATMTNATATVVALKKEQYLHNAEIVNNVVEKLPATLRNECYTYITEQPEDIPDLVKLTQFAKRAAARCSRFAPMDIAASDRREPAPKKTARTYHVDTTTAAKPACPICGEKHEAAACPTLKRAEVPARWDIAKKYKLCFRCMKIRKYRHSCKPKQCDKDGCTYMHHPLLHGGTYASTASTQVVQESEAVTTAREERSATGLLKILQVRVTGPKGSLDTYALLDDGSTCTLIESAVAQQIGATGPPSPFYIEGVSGMKIDASESRRVNLKICGRNTSEVDICARTVPDIGVSPQTVPAGIVESCPHLQDIKEDILYERGAATILLGQDNWELLLTHAFKSGARGQPVASLTTLGWVLHGVQYRQPAMQRVHHLTVQPLQEETMEKMMRDHFALESLCVDKKKSYTEAERRALTQLEENTRALPAGGYETCLLWKEDDPRPPDNYSSTMKRLELLERKLDKNEAMKTRYNAQMQVLLDSGYAEEAPREKNEKIWYLPHFAVINPQKPEKLRIVHDAAARTRGTSLNDMLLPGPDLLQSLPGVLMRFRQHPVAVSADIKDMFMRVHIREEDRDMQRFLWRGDRRAGPPTEYRMKSVIFGATSSPCTAIYVKNSNAERYKDIYPEAAEAVVRNHYVDDYLASYETEEEAVRISTEVNKIHHFANYDLQKWTSNSRIVLAQLSSSEAEDPRLLQLDPGKLLGMVWHPEDDTLSFNLNKHRIPEAILSGERTPTKREALRTVMSIYDPLGLATPVTVQAKRILQDVWRSGIDWDAQLEDNEARAWRSWIEHAQQLPRLAVPRCYASYSGAATRELHIFVDASSSAYAAVVYWRVIDQEGNTHLSLVSGKARVAQLNKVVSIPRLELQAAVLGCRLAQAAIEEHDLKPSRRVYWSDSRTVLTWLRNGPRTYKPFVAHRVAEISDTTKTKEWRWVPTKENTADDATRDTPPDFNSSHRWYRGPAFLYLPEEHWPREEKIVEEDTGEERTLVTVAATRLSEALPDITRFSNFMRVIRATARVLQFIELLRAKKQTVLHKRTKKNEEADPAWTSTTPRTATRAATPAVKTAVRKYLLLSARHMHRARQLWLRSQQQENFAEEIAALQKSVAIPTTSRLHNLSVILDEEKIIRLRSRIATAADITPSQREPAVLDGNHRWTRLYIAWVHKQLHHGGFETTANEVRQHYWVLRLRHAVRSEVKQCLACRIRKATHAQPSTGNHPHTRLAHHQRPFTYTGLDYFGPLMVTVGRTKQKRYGVLFTCLTTRAVHLEVAGSLSTDSAIMALRRFIARRNCPSELHSDNGTNLRGADVELKKAALAAMEEEASVRFIQWRYIPPSAPFMGGAWERLVRSVKNALQVTLHERAPKEEVLATLLVEAEHTINSRPLTHVSTSADDEEALTPNHFLLGAPSRVPLP